jgi:hypothetical protein
VNLTHCCFPVMGADLSRSMLLAASAIDDAWDMPASVVPLCRWYFGRICRNFHSHANSGMIFSHRWRVERGIMISFKGAHFAKDIILTRIEWYVAYPLSYRQLEEMRQERGVSVDHATINRWVLKYIPRLAVAFHRRKRLVSHSWRLDETYIQVRGPWR